MGLISNKIDKRMLKPGDHIYGYRNAHLYSHHGIYVGENMVIHFTRTKQKNRVDGRRLRTGRRCGVCGYESKTQLGVVKTCLDCFLRGHSVHLFEYNVSREHYAAKFSGTCSTGSCHPPDVVIQRATAMLHGGQGFGDYSLFDNNCESFALYCTTGDRSSGFQALSFMSKADILIRNLTGPQPFSFGETVAQLALTHKIDKIRDIKDTTKKEDKSRDIKDMPKKEDKSRDIKEMPKKEENHVKGTPPLIMGLVFVIVCFIMFFLGFSLSSSMR